MMMKKINLRERRRMCLQPIVVFYGFLAVFVNLLLIKCHTMLMNNNLHQCSRRLENVRGGLRNKKEKDEEEKEKDEKEEEEDKEKDDGFEDKEKEKEEK